MFRQMRRHAQQLDTTTCQKILAQAPRGVLAVLGDEGYPYAVPLNFCYEADPQGTSDGAGLGRIYFHGAVEGHKLDAIAACDKASFCVLDEGVREKDDWWYHFNSVIAFGRVRRVSDEREVLASLRALGAKYFPADYDTEADIARNLRHVAVLELRIEHLSGKHVREK